MIRSIVIGLFVLLGFELSAQTLKEFSSDKKAYLTELTGLFESQGKEDEINFLYEFFVPKWDSLSEQQVKQIIELSNALLKKQAKASPHFYHFLGAYYYFTAGKGGDQLNNWMSITQQICKSKTRSNLEKYLETSFLLLRDGALYSSTTVSWTATGSFDLAFDSVPSFGFSNTVLTGKSKADYSTLSEVSGRYFPFDQKFIGSKGKITWEKTGLSPDKNYATFGDFQLNLAATLFDIKGATLRTEYYPQPILGKVRDKIFSALPEDRDYPAFDSDRQRVEIKDILPGMDYQGGFAIRGPRFSGIGYPDQPSILILKYKNKAFVEASSLEFNFDSTKIQSPLAKITIRVSKDSIIHSGLKFRFDRKENRVDLVRDDNSGSSGPFYSSYHEIDFFVEKLSWLMGDSLLEMGSLRGTANNVASFESANFFETDRYKALQFPNGPHPLMQLRNYCNQNKEREFSVTDYANFLSIEDNAAKQLLIDLSNKGFITFDFDADQVVVKKKMFDFLLANQKKLDYDVILFDSRVSSSLQPNALLNLNNNDLQVFGVKKIDFSNAQSVAFFADKRTPYVTVKKNRNLAFAGVLRAGGFDFYGDSFLFNYDKFRVDLLKVDSVMLYVKKDFTDSTGSRSEFVPVQTKIRDITGELLIDNPINKSGLDSLNNKAYPILKTNEPSFAYYDKPTTYDGIYPREKFFFKIDPFLLDSLDNFNQDVLRFKGVLVSAGIFPDIVDSLAVQEDFSLGFKHQTPPGGLPLYSDKAKFDKQITLSDKGLVGDGDLTYISSVSSSNKFTFFPDSTTGIARQVANTKQNASPDVPQFNGGDLLLRFVPKEDYLTWYTVKSKMQIFDGDARHTGTLTLTPARLTGTGKSEMFDGELNGQLFRFNNSNIFSDTANFKLNAVGENNLAISTEQISAQVDFNYRVGTFKALSGAAVITFPKNRYQADMDTYKWLVDEKIVELSNASASNDTVEGGGARFLSIHPDQDSLSFRVGRAQYDVKNYRINCFEVKRVLVADVIVEPDQGQLTILPDAVIKPLQNAVITADFVNRFHTIFNATVELLSANNYLAKGDYNYEDDEKNQQKINFQTIYVDSARHTAAKGKIPEEMNFKLNKYFDYRGEVILKAPEKGLFFNGSTRILTNCEKIERNWLAFYGQVDPQEVLIPVGDTMKNDLGQTIGAGIMIERSDSAVIYPTFISAKHLPTDDQITTALGYLWYDKEAKTYNIGSAERFKRTGLQGNLVSLNTQTCDITANGRLNVGTDLGQVNVEMVGDARYDYKTEDVQISGLLMIDFFFERKMLEYLSTKAATYPFLQPVNLGSSQYEKALTDYAPKKRADLMDEYNKKGLLGGIPEEMSKSLVFANVAFDWDQERTSFVSKGSLGLLNTYDKPVMVNVNGKMQIMRSRRGNEVVTYMEYDPNTWYFFKYKKDETPRMLFYSSDAEFMKFFETVKEKDRKMKTKKDEASYEFDLAPRTSKDSFFERFE
ncbi:MAG TPA: hypothetical protein VFV37_07100 [Luteibaculaceae bacterium]|nr:hypothetical protein [Luteibaculaceae bacterium]